MFASPDKRDDLAQGDVDVQESQATKGAAEVWVIPEVLHGYLVGGEEARDVIEVPGIHPGEDYQERADFKGEDGE